MSSVSSCRKNDLRFIGSQNLQFGIELDQKVQEVRIVYNFVGEIPEIAA